MAATMQTICTWLVAHVSQELDLCQNALTSLDGREAFWDVTQMLLCDLQEIGLQSRHA